MRTLILLLLSLSALAAQASTDTVLYKLNSGKQPNENYVSYIRKAWREKGVWQVRDYNVEDSSLNMSGAYLDDDFKTQTGMHYNYYPEGTLRDSVKYIDGQKQGLMKGYATNGRLTDSTFYKDDVPHLFSYRWFDNGKIEMIGEYAADGSGTDTGYYEDGSLDFHGMYTDGHWKDGKWVYYHPNGQASAHEYFDRDKMVKSKCFTPEGRSQSCGMDLSGYNKLVKRNQNEGKRVYHFAEVMPEAGYSVNNFLAANINYPTDALKENIVGRAMMQFIVAENGALTEIKVLNKASLHPSIAREALRVVSAMPAWQKPGKQHNRPVKVYFTLPINFAISD